MTNEQKIISDLREWLRVQTEDYEEMLSISSISRQTAQCVDMVLSSIKLTLDELEQKYCNKVVETDKRVYACSDCGHPHKLEDLILLDSEPGQVDSLNHISDARIPIISKFKRGDKVLLKDTEGYWIIKEIHVWPNSVTYDLGHQGYNLFNKRESDLELAEEKPQAEGTNININKGEK